jgi:hypothetical protein
MLDPDPDSMESKVLDILVFRTEGSSLDFLYGGLGIIKLQFVSSKKKTFFQLYFSKFVVIKTLDPDPDSMESGSTTLVLLTFDRIWGARYTVRGMGYDVRVTRHSFPYSV